MNREFRVTFGQKYRREEHLSGLPAHPDGWATVWAADEPAARRIVVDKLGPNWADLYDTAEYPRGWGYFPLGELFVLNPEAAP